MWGKLTTNLGLLALCLRWLRALFAFSAVISVYSRWNSMSGWSKSMFNRGLRLHLISYNCIPRRGGKQDAQPWRKPVFLPSLRSWDVMLPKTGSTIDDHSSARFNSLNIFTICPHKLDKARCRPVLVILSLVKCRWKLMLLQGKHTLESQFYVVHHKHCDLLEI